MEKAIREDLDRLMQKYNEKLAQVKMAKSDRESLEQAFAARFNEARQKVIRPVMEEVGRYLRRQGHDFQICERGNAAVEGMDRYVSVKLSVFPSDVRRAHFSEGRTPSVSFIASPGMRAVWVHRCSTMPGRQGIAGYVAEYPLEELTCQAVEREVLKLLRGVF
jgi:hypothetical protein